jgi:DNA polymerase III epsilon subunit
LAEFDTTGPFDGYSYVSIDVETTGLQSRSGDRVCEIALVRIEGGAIAQTFSSLVNPGRPISRDAFEVNGITDEMVRDSPRFCEIAASMLERLEGAVLVAHNATFDMGFLEEELLRAGLALPDMPVLDTLLLARRAYAFRNNSLGVLSRNLGIPIEREHRALADAITTARVLCALLEGLRSRGLRTLGDVLEFQWGRSTAREGAVPESELHPIIEEAIISSGTLKIVYHSHRGKTSRLVRPVQLSCYGSHRYMTAYCFLRGEERVFRLDRILKAERA